jgi:polyhydroxyalkanoate synthesis regulator phasin
MNENRRQILEMLAAGKINAEEAERLLNALEREPQPAAPAAAPAAAARAKAKYIRVTVDAENIPGKAPTKVNVRVPMQLLRSGVRLAGLIPLQARAHVESAMREKGIAIDLSQIRPENLEEIVDQLQDLTVDVDDENARVRVFTE